MSGGHFDYMQYHIDEIADSIEDYLNGKELDADEIEIDNYIEERYLEQDEIDYIRKHRRTIPTLNVCSSSHMGFTCADKECSPCRDKQMIGARQCADYADLP